MCSEGYMWRNEGIKYRTIHPKLYFKEKNMTERKKASSIGLLGIAEENIFTLKSNKVPRK